MKIKTKFIFLILINVFLMLCLLKSMLESIVGGCGLWGCTLNQFVVGFQCFLLFASLFMLFIFSIHNKFIKIFVMYSIGFLAILLICMFWAFPLHKINIDNRINEIKRIAIEKNDEAFCNNIKEIKTFTTKYMGKDYKINSAFYDCMYDAITNKAVANNDITICEKLSLKNGCMYAVFKNLVYSSKEYSSIILDNNFLSMTTTTKLWHDNVKNLCEKDKIYKVLYPDGGCDFVLNSFLKDEQKKQNIQSKNK